MASKIILLAAGGTGGHIFPAEALAEVLLARGFEPHLITDKRFHGYITGNTHGALRDIPIHTISSGSLGGNVIKKVKNLLGIGVGAVQAAGWIQKLQPMAVVGFGGYPSFPTMLAAAILKRRTILHEQNSVLGRVNRALAPYVTTVATTYAETKFMPANLSSRFAKGDTGISATQHAAQIASVSLRYASSPVSRSANRDDSDRVVHTGNPVRAAVKALTSAPYPALGENGAMNLFVLGGSQGASVFSEVLPAAMALLPEALRARIHLVQQCRQTELAEVQAKYDALGMQVTLAPFFTDIPERLKAAHLVISRAGASSVAELMVAGRPAMLVPLPSAMDNHQFFNAQAVEKNGAGWVIPQAEFTAQSLASRLEMLAHLPKNLADCAAAMRSLGTPNAAEKLADVVVG